MTLGRAPRSPAAAPALRALWTAAAGSHGAATPSVVPQWLLTPSPTGTALRRWLPAEGLQAFPDRLSWEMRTCSSCLRDQEPEHTYAKAEADLAFANFDLRLVIISTEQIH